jgi:hypothetical protein
MRQEAFGLDSRAWRLCEISFGKLAFNMFDAFHFDVMHNRVWIHLLEQNYYINDLSSVVQTVQRT